MMTTDGTDRNAYVALGAIFGIAAGIGVGMLLAPRSGQETRKIIRERSMAAKDGAHRQLMRRRDMAMRSLSSSLDKSKGMIDKAADKTKDAASQAQAETDTARARRAVP